MNLTAILDGMMKVKASDLHLKVDHAPMMRLQGALRPVDHPKLNDEDMKKALDQSMPDRLAPDLEKNGATDFAYSCNGGRFRVAAFHQRGHISITFRNISMEAPTIESLNLPKPIANLHRNHRGIVLVTGITGSGKSTTLAAMIEQINNTRRDHIVTIEDPIEYIYTDNLCLINQMEVGLDCTSFREIMPHILRFDPDVILVGEMRNRETVQAGLQAADTGHLVFSTLHTSDAKQTVNRILHFFEKQDEELILEQLSLNLRAIISQRLLPRSDIKGRVPACELLLNTPIVTKLIREGRIDDLEQVLKSREGDMRSFDVALALLVQEGKIDEPTGYKYCSDDATLKRMILGDFGAGDVGGLIGGGAKY